MNWLAANWLWIVIGVAFVAFHLVGHRGHRGHGGHGSDRSKADSAGSARPTNDGSVPPASDKKQTHVH